VTDLVITKVRSGIATRDLLELTKPRIVMLVLLTAVTGVVLAPVRPEFIVTAGFLTGVAMLAGGVNALNQYLERDCDALMRRTCRRPVPAGRLSPRTAFVFASSLTVVGLSVLFVTVNVLTTALGALTAVLYVLVYTPLKRRSEWCTIIGAVPGAIPPLMGWTAATGGIGLFGVLLFALLFFWQLPHFMAISWLCREDYRDGGFVMSSGRDDGGASAAAQAMIFAALTFFTSVVPYFVRLTSTTYVVTALITGAALLYLALAFAMQRDRRSAMRLFVGSNVYLVVTLIALVATI